MGENERLHGYASTERDTDLGIVEFRPWEEIRNEIPPGVIPDLTLDNTHNLHSDGTSNAEVPLFAVACILGTDYLLSVYKSHPDSDGNETCWQGGVQIRNQSWTAIRTYTREKAIDGILAYARDTLTDEEGVIECLRETDREFVRQARDAGASVTFMNDGSERNKLIEIRIGSDLSTDEHPFRQGFRLSAYARPEGCHWGCWYYFDGVDFPYSRQRGITVDARKGFSVARIVEDAGRCDGCGRSFHIDELRTVGFANASCPECREKLKGKFEPKGWCD